MLRGPGEERGCQGPGLRHPLLQRGPQGSSRGAQAGGEWVDCGRCLFRKIISGQQSGVLLDFGGGDVERGVLCTALAREFWGHAPNLKFNTTQ